MTIRTLACAAAAALACLAAPASAATFIGDNVTIKRAQGGTYPFPPVSATVGAGAEYGDNFFTIDITANQVIFDARSSFSTGSIVYEIAGLDFDGDPATANVVEDFSFSQILGTAANPFGLGRISFGPNNLLKVDFSQTTGGSAGLATITLGAAPLSGAVPEPATWAMMIGGFGLAGGALRARRRKTRLAYSL